MKKEKDKVGKGNPKILFFLLLFCGSRIFLLSVEEIGSRKTQRRQLASPSSLTPFPVTFCRWRCCREAEAEEEEEEEKRCKKTLPACS